MRIGLLSEHTDHPTLTEVADLLESRSHEVIVLNECLGTPAEIAATQQAHPASVYLCKSHSRHALELATLLESYGTPVINDSAATAFAQDRVGMARRLLAAGVAAPRTDVLARLDTLDSVNEPIVVKSQRSRRGDLVSFVDSSPDLAALREEWSAEPVVVQTWIPNGGWDLKLWVAGSAVFGARRPTPLELTGPPRPQSGGLPSTILLAAGQIPGTAVRTALAVGEAFGLEIYGVDIVTGPEGSMVVDVNPFPGARGIPGFASAVVDLALVRAQRPLASPLR